MKNCSTLRRENTLRPEHFWKLSCRKVHKVVARSTFASQNVEKHTMRGTLLDIEMLKKCTTLLREAHVEVKSVRNWRFRTTF